MKLKGNIEEDEDLDMRDQSIKRSGSEHMGSNAAESDHTQPAVRRLEHRTHGAILPDPLFDGTLKVIPPPRARAMRRWKAGASPTLYSFLDTSQQSDPCLTDCALCSTQDHVSVGTGFACLCHKGYRDLVKAGDYRVKFGDRPPYEFLIAGAAFQTSAVQQAVAKYFVRMLKVAAQCTSCGKEVSLDLDRDDFLGKTIIQRERGMVFEQLMAALKTSKDMLKYKSNDKLDNDMRTQLMAFNLTEGSRQTEQRKVGSVMGTLAGFAQSTGSGAIGRMNIREMMSAIYLLQAPVAKTLDDLAANLKNGGSWPEVETWVDTKFLLEKKDLSDEYCAETQNQSAPCERVYNVQAQKFHMEQDFTQPFDGWFNWRFIPKTDGSVPQKGPFTKDFKVPIKTRPQTTLNLLEAIGAGYSEQELNTYKSYHGISGDVEGDIPIDIGAGIAWWNQEDCDCSVERCQPSENQQACEGGFPRVSERVGGRSVAGPSGTTQKMITTARYLRTSDVDLYLLRLGLIAWMVPLEDHSLLEILMGAEDAGIPFPHNSGMYSLKHLLPDPVNQRLLAGAQKDLQRHLQALHDHFGIDVDERGPQAKC